MLSTNTIYPSFNFGECSGSGTFEQPIAYFNYDYENATTVGLIPKGLQGLRVTLISDNDVDIRLYGENSDKIVHWPSGILSHHYQQTKLYKTIPITYSGYNGVSGKYGHEFIEINGSTPTVLTMKAFGYKAGYATVNYSWSGKDACTQDSSGTGYFTQALTQNATSLVGTIPPNVENLEVKLTSDKDLDIQLYGSDGTAIVSWKPTGLLSSATKQSIIYHDMNITWSGYNGTEGKQGHEYITVKPQTTEVLIMKVFGYEAGVADVTYSWGDGELPINNELQTIITYADGHANTSPSLEDYNALGVVNFDHVKVVALNNMIKNLGTSIPINTINKVQTLAQSIDINVTQFMPLEKSNVNDHFLDDFKKYFGFKVKTLTEQNQLRDTLIEEVNANGTTYYIDSINGNDQNNGKTELTAWKTIEHIKGIVTRGDIVLLKRAQVHVVPDTYDWDEVEFPRGVVYSAYGVGVMPIIEPNKNRNYLNWIDNGDGTWSTTNSHTLKRMWLNGIEIHRSTYSSDEAANEELHSDYPWKVQAIDNAFRITLLSENNPNTQNIEFYQRIATIYTNNGDISLVNLDIRGSEQTIKFYGADENIIKNCKIGKGGIYGIYIESGSHNIIDNVELMSGQYFLDSNGSETVSTAGRKTTNRGAFEGIRITKSSDNNSISNITFSGWTHVAFQLYNGPENNTLNNFLINAAVLYGDGLTIDHANTINNEIANGYVIHMKKNHQINATGSKFHDIIMHKTSVGTLDRSTSVALRINPYSGNINGVKIYNNTFIDIEGSGIMVTGTKSNKHIENIEINNNNFYNTAFNTQNIILRDIPLLAYVVREGADSSDSQLSNIEISNNTMYDTLSPFGILEGRSGRVNKFTIEELNTLSTEEYIGYANQISLD